MHHQEKIMNIVIFLLVDKSNAHQVHKYGIKNPIYLSFSSMIRRRTFLSDLKALKMICFMAKQEEPFTQKYLQRVQRSTSVTNFLRHALKETNLYKSNHPQCIQDYRHNCRSPGYYCRRRAYHRCSLSNTRRCLMRIKRTTSQPIIVCYDEKYFGVSRPK